MRRIRYLVAMSLDGYIAGPHGEADWIIMDPEIDFAALFAEFDTMLMGRQTFDFVRKQEGGDMLGIRSVVFSRTLRHEDHPDVTIVGDNVVEFVADLREQTGKDIWLFGGGGLFRSLLDAGLVDSVEVAVMPVLLGGGTPLLPQPASRKKLKLDTHKVYKSGVVSLSYSVQSGT